MHPSRCFFAALSLSLVVVSIAACNDDPVSSGGSGTERITTYGEDYIEDRIPADPAGLSGLLNGWSVKYNKFLVSFHEVTIKDDQGNVGFELEKPIFFDNTKKGAAGDKLLAAAFPLEAKAWTDFSYQIKPAVADETLGEGADPADLAMMVQNGWSIYVDAVATQTAADGTVKTKTFKWGFKSATQYTSCQVAEGGQSRLGIVVTNGAADTTQLTTHGDHFYYDRLQSSPDPAVQTLLRFDEKAQADDAPNGNADGDITLQELCTLQFDPTTYNPSGFNVATVGDFVISLSRTVGHFRGEGECEVSALEPTRPKLPCDDYR